MPAIVTHYQFAEEALQRYPDVCGDSRDECDAFLLGSQGPDPLFFIPGPEPFGTRRLARAMHSSKPSELLAALKQGVSALPEDEQGIAQSYAHGFLCHYLLDAKAHPLVYATIDALCSTGVDGLSSDDAKIVHTFIEREWDELILTTKLGTTVADFHPVQALQASDRVLTIVQKLYAFMALGVYGMVIDTEAFLRAMSAYRLEQRLLRSRRGGKIKAAALYEKVVRSRSRARAAALRPVRVENSWLANPENDTWNDPSMSTPRTESFNDLYEEALAALEEAVALFESTSFDIDMARQITAELNFRGEPTVATLTVHS